MISNHPPETCSPFWESFPAGALTFRDPHLRARLRSPRAAQPPPTEPRPAGTPDADGTRGGAAARHDRAAGGPSESDTQLALPGAVVAGRRVLAAGAGTAAQRPPGGADRTPALHHPPGVGGRLPGGSAGAAARDHALVERQLSPPAGGRRHRPAGGGRAGTGGRAAAYLRRVGRATLAAVQRTRPARPGHGRARRGGAGAGAAARRVGGVRARPAHLGGGLAGTAAGHRHDRR